MAVWVVQQWLSHDRKAKNPVAVQLSRRDVLSVPWYWSPRGFRETCSSAVSVEVLKKWVLIPEKECLSDSPDELARKNRGKQAKSKGFLLPREPPLEAVVFALALRRAFPTQMIQSNNPSQVCPDVWVIVDS